MSALLAHVKMLRALGAQLHRVAEERMPRAGKIAPETKFPDKSAARILGSFAQACERAADDLDDEMKRALP